MHADWRVDRIILLGSSELGLGIVEGEDKVPDGTRCAVRSSCRPYLVDMCAGQLIIITVFY